jgi:crossover junction endodeoxyribonuclease RuvC
MADTLMFHSLPKTGALAGGGKPLPPAQKGRSFTVLGVDPGLAATGYAVLAGTSLETVRVLAQGTIRTSPKAPVEGRIGEIHDRLEEIAKNHLPNALVIEDHFNRKNAPGAGLMLGPVIGVVILLSHRMHLPFATISPRELKHRITGYGGASKEAVQQSLSIWLGPRIHLSSTHESDAMGLAFIGFSRLFTP